MKFLCTKLNAPSMKKDMTVLFCFVDDFCKISEIYSELS